MPGKFYILWFSSLLFFVWGGHSAYSQDRSLPSQQKAPRYTRSLRVISDNDFFFLGSWTDRYYSFGSFIQYRQYISPRSRVGRFLYASNSRKTQRIIWGLGIGQEGYTSSNFEEAEGVRDLDRPHAGWLYAKPELVLLQEGQLWRISAEFGVVGPLSGAEKSQRLVHKLFSMPLPQGWENQIPNHFAFNLRLDWIRPVFSSSFLEVISEMKAQLGLESSFIQPGFRIRLGSLKAFDQSISYQVDLGSKQEARSRKWEVFLDLEGHAQLLANHATVHGGDLEEAFGANWDLRRLGYGFSSGLNLSRGRLGSRYAMHLTQGEVQDLETHKYASIQLTYRF